MPKTLPRTPQDPPKRLKIDPRPPEDSLKESFLCYPLFSSVCSSLSLLSRLFSFSSVLFCLLYSFFSSLSFLFFVIQISSLLSLSLSFFRFSSFSSLLALFPNCGGELTYWAVLGRSWGSLGCLLDPLGRSWGLLGRPRAILVSPTPPSDLGPN